MNLKNALRGELDLTDGTCNTLEDLCLSLEVLMGARVRYKRLHFERGLLSGSGVFTACGEEHELLFDKRRGRESVLPFFDVRIDGKWYVARFDSPEQVRVIATTGSLERGDADFKASMVWTVGTSATDRREEPLDLG